MKLEIILAPLGKNSSEHLNLKCVDLEENIWLSQNGDEIKRSFI